MAIWRNGIRSRLKICRPKGIEGSNPSIATKKRNKMTFEKVIEDQIFDNSEVIHMSVSEDGEKVAIIKPNNLEKWLVIVSAHQHIPRDCSFINIRGKQYDALKNMFIKGIIE
jgi:hypothetical protein